MGIFGKIFTWWDGATLGTHLWASRQGGEHVGTDYAGNKYYRKARKADKDGGVSTGSYTQNEKRWVIYNGINDSSRVPAEWHGWLHLTLDVPPTEQPLKRQSWETDHQPNMTGTKFAYRPQGSLREEGARRESASDYEAWKPDA